MDSGLKTEISRNKRCGASRVVLVIIDASFEKVILHYISKDILLYPLGTERYGIECNIFALLRLGLLFRPLTQYQGSVY